MDFFFFLNSNNVFSYLQERCEEVIILAGYILKNRVCTIGAILRPSKRDISFSTLSPQNEGQLEYLKFPIVYNGVETYNI